jgi:hypothetical protein
VQEHTSVVTLSRLTFRIFRSESLFRKAIGAFLTWSIWMGSLPVYAANGPSAQWVRAEQFQSSPYALPVPASQSPVALTTAWGSSKSSLGVSAVRSPRHARVSVPSQLRRESNGALLRPTARGVISHGSAAPLIQLPGFKAMLVESPGVAGTSLLPTGLNQSKLSGMRPLLMQAGPPSPIQVAVAFADSSSTTANFPEPWNESNSLISFVGGGTVYRAGAVRLDNPTTSLVTLDSVTVDLGRPGPVFQLWTNITIPAKGSAISHADARRKLQLECLAAGKLRAIAFADRDTDSKNHRNDCGCQFQFRGHGPRTRYRRVRLKLPRKPIVGLASHRRRRRQ